MCLGVFLLCLPGTLCFLELVDYFFSHVRKVFSYYLFKYFSLVVSLFSFWNPYNASDGAFNVVPKRSWASQVVLVVRICLPMQKT